MKEKKKETKLDAAENKPSALRRLGRDVAVFGNLRVLCFAAMLCAMSVVLGYFAKLLFGTGPFRVTFENLPIIFGSLSFGPFVGAMIAAGADLCSCLLSGQAPNPLILVGSVTVGLVSGFLGGYLVRGRRYLSLLLVELASHLIGSVVLKSTALHVYYGFPWIALLPRLPLYIAIALLEAYVLHFLFANRQMKQFFERIWR